MNKTTVSFLLAFIAFTAAAEVGPDGCEYTPLKVDGIEYSLKCSWFHNTSYPGMMRNVSHFFIYEGDIYFNQVNLDDTDKIYKIVGSDGTHQPDIHTMTVDWQGSRPSGQPLGYCGNDTAGNPYIVSKSNGSSDYPFELYLLGFENGRPYPLERISIPFYPSDFDNGNESNRYTCEVQIKGDITTGNFLLAAPIWSVNEPSPTYLPQTYVGIWTFENGRATNLETARLNTTLAHIMPISSNSFAVIDNNSFQTGNSNPTNMIDPRPSIYTIVNGKPYLDFTFTAEEPTMSGNGMDIFKFGNVTFMAYASSSSPKFKIATLTDYPESMDGKIEWELAPEQNWSDNRDNTNYYYRTLVKAWKKDDNNMQLFFDCHNGGMASYNLSLYDPTVTGINDISIDKESTMPTEYFDLQGRQVLNPSQGLYLVRKGGKVVKEYVR